MKVLLYVTALIVGYAGYANAANISTENDAVDYTIALIQKYKLTTISTEECLHYDISDRGVYFFVRVRENHTKNCGGDPMTSPTVFFMKIWKHKDVVLTDAYDREEYVPVKQAAKLIAKERIRDKGRQ